MRKTLTKTGNSLALVLDKPLLEQMGIDAATELEVSASGDVLIITPVRPRARDAKLKRAMEAIDARYAGVFKKLAE